MKIRVYLGILIVVAIASVTTTGMQASASSDSGQAENATNHDSTGNWQTVLMADGKECEGMVFKSADAAKQEALKMGCSGYHEHHKNDGTVVYMPCALDDVDIKDVKTELLDALARGEIPQEQFDGKLAWLESRIRD